MKKNIAKILLTRKNRNCAIIVSFFLLMIQPVFSQENIRLSGVVVDDEYKETLIGVTIQEVGTNNYTTTDTEGKFTLYNVNGMSARIKFTYVGYQEYIATVPANKVLNIRMLTDKMQLDEVVVVGYGSQKKESVVGAIATIKPSVLVQNTTRSITNGLAGQVAGVIAVQKQGSRGVILLNFGFAALILSALILIHWF